ncbi:unnamed protein product [Durusdinium trenchii]|uniref:Sugar phosphate transporter domain-containing protein n=1 Tax=Durusdinium trenchii TaxID=1381693 RepID=A0ABP0SXU7_9DINO
MLEGRAEEKDPHHETWRSVSFGASAAEGRILVIMYACLTYVPGVISPFFPFLVSLLLQLSHPCEFLYAKPIRMLTGFQSFCSPRSVGHRTRPGQENMTDWEVLKQLLDRNPYVLLHVFTSGVLSLIYNSLQYTMVHKLSATHATFAGNFNKAATIALSLFLGLEALPSGLYGKIFVLAILGNITAFTAFSASKAK